MLYALLRYVDIHNNNNKDYEMCQVNENQFIVKYGRIENSKMEKTYSISEWDKIYAKKIKKGYIDMTRYVSNQSVNKYKKIDNEVIEALVNQLLRYANDYVEANYTIEKSDVTEMMLEQGQNIVNRLSRYLEETGSYYSSVPYFNELLGKLFTVIPRKMKDTHDYLAKTEKDYPEIIEREQKNLDILSSVCDTANNSSKKNTDKKTILETFGISIRECTEKEIEQTKSHLGTESAHLFDSVYYVSVDSLEKRQQQYMKAHNLNNKDIHYFYHGSKNENIWSLIKNGPTNKHKTLNGSMFGKCSAYLAPRAKKSIGYTSLRGSYWASGSSNTAFMLVMKAVYKKPLDVYTYSNDYSCMTEKKLNNLGYDSLFAHKGTMLLNDEVCIYNDAQIVPRYLIKLKA